MRTTRKKLTQLSDVDDEDESNKLHHLALQCDVCMRLFHGACKVEEEAINRNAIREELKETTDYLMK